MLYRIINILLFISLWFKYCLTFSKFPILIVISFDGFRHDYIDTTHTPHLHSLASDGVRAKWMNNVFVTKTFPNHFSIATGLYEETHGIVSNIMYDPEMGAAVDMAKTSDPRWWNNNFSNPIWIANQMSHKDRHSGCVFWSGSDVQYFGNQLPKYHLKYNATVGWKYRVDTAVSWLTSDKDPANLILFYFEEPDWTAHWYGTDSKEVKEQIRRADNITGYLIERLKKVELFNQANIIVLSDHGMINIREVIDLDNFVDAKLYQTYGVTPVFNLWPNSEENEKIIYNNLKKGSATSNFTVYKADEIPDYFHYKHHRRILKIIVVADEGYQLVNSHYPKSRETLRADHGYSNLLPSMHPIFIAHGPAFKKAYVSEPFLNLDVYPLMNKILGIPISPNNGSLENIQHILLLHQGSSKPAYVAVAICILISFLLIGGAYYTAVRFKPLNKGYSRYSEENYFPEEKDNLLFSDE